jgi:hypothetical protein
MSHKQKLYSRNDLQKDLIDDIGRIIKCYTTAMILITFDSKGQQYPEPIGSGTFVSMSDAFGILTAAHVVEKLMKEKHANRPYLLGLTPVDYPQKYAIPSDLLEPIIIAKGKTESRGPDLGFIVLPDSERGTILATKNIHNLNKNRERILSTPPGFNEEVWAICGFPGEKTIDEHPKKRFEPYTGFFMLAIFGFISGTYTLDEYDYCDFKVKHDPNSFMPDRFAGMSGGGLWHIPLKESSEGNIEPKEYILSGVVFYETGWEGLYKSIRCHARNSIYDKAHSYITENRKPKTGN